MESPLLCQRILCFFQLRTPRIGPGSVEVSCDPHLFRTFSAIHLCRLFIINQRSTQRPLAFPANITPWPESNDVSAALQLLEWKRNRTWNGHEHWGWHWYRNCINIYIYIPVHVRDGQHPV